MNRQGYIKISRGINQHWLWQDAERLKWWLDLLLLASWEDTETMHDSHRFTLKRGQMIASVSFLKERWKVSHPTIIRFLSLLEAEGMIKREILYRQTPIITICKYESYQGFSDNDVYTQVYGQVYRQVYTNKENKEINISTTNARAREKELLLQDMSWSELIRMRYRLTQEQYRSELDNFFTDCECNGINGHKDLQDLKSHFNSWISKKQLTTKTTQDNGRSKRRPAPATNGSKADYDAAF